MSISYSAITNFGKLSLPSVETWGTNMNILRDPPRSITTRRIDKVGQDSSITETIDQSENRAAEAITQYARGVNPFVSVSYNNNGNNGGQLSGGISGSYNNTQASLPYKISDSFRPPAIGQINLQPLSRLPRAWTTAYTQPGFADFSKKMKVCGTAADTKEVKDNLLKTSARPTAVYIIETPLERPYETKYKIQDVLKSNVRAPVSTTDRTQQVNYKAGKEINNNMINTSAVTNIKAPVNITDITQQFNYKGGKEINNNMINTSAVTNIKADHTQITSIDEILDLSVVKTKDINNINYHTPLRGNDKTEYIHDPIELERVIPLHQAHTNFKQPTDKTLQHEYMKEYERNTPLTNYATNIGMRGENNISSTQYKLIPKISPGEYNVPASIPNQNRIQELYSPFQNEKSRINKSVSMNYQRY